MTVFMSPRFLRSILLICGVAALASACDAPLDDSEIESTTEAIIGGTPTLVRPEVGWIAINGSGCTATLISSRHFLTAAHCIDYAPMTRGGVFTIQPAGGGASERFPIGRTASIGWTAVGVANPGPAWQDVAVGELTREVPESLALPARIAAAQVRKGDRVTIMGYAAEGGSRAFETKRVTEFVVTGRNIVTNPGDSGGPVFLGPLPATGPIVLVTSHLFEGPIVTDRDLFGDPVRLRSAVFAMMDALGTPGVCYRIYANDAFGYSEARCNGAQAGFRDQDVGGVQIWSNTPGSVLCYTGNFEGQGFPSSRACDGELLGSKSLLDRKRFTDLQVWFHANSQGNSVFYRGFDGPIQTREAKNGQSWLQFDFILDRLAVRQGR